MGKGGFAVRRIAQLAITIWAVGTVLFAMFRIMPGDPTSLIISPQLDAEARQQIIANYGLNEPLWIQYVKYMENLVTLNFGRSFQTQEPVGNILANYLPNTLVLMLSALFIAYSVGTILGVFTGWYRGTSFEKSTVVLALVARSIPSFWVGILVLWIGGSQLNIIPMSGMTSIGVQFDSFWAMVTSTDFLWHLIAPVSVLAFYYMGYPLLIMRNSMLEVLSQDFIDICRAKGLTERTIMFRHAARNALLPVLTASAIAIGFAIGGSVLIETVFGWPGIGREMIRAVLRRDYPVAQGIFIVLAASVILMNFIADLLYGILDPRVSYE